MAQFDAEALTILRGTVGSTLHGLAVGDQDDRDEMGICVEPWGHFFGLGQRFEQYIKRTQPEGVRSGPGDLDLTIYSLAKWARLALGGNPTILTLLFLPEHAILVDSQAGRDLRAFAPHFVGNSIFGPYLGYMAQQRHRMTNKVKMPNRPELVERYGYDTKYAGHIIRLGYQGIEMATACRMTLPMPPHQRERILAIRTGKVSEADVLEEAAALEAKLMHLRDTSSLPPPNVALVEQFVLDTYLSHHPRPS